MIVCFFPGFKEECFFFFEALSGECYTFFLISKENVMLLTDFKIILVFFCLQGRMLCFSRFLR